MRQFVPQIRNNFGTYHKEGMVPHQDRASPITDIPLLQFPENNNNN